jgi:hypothetical protein
VNRAPPDAEESDAEDIIAPKDTVEVALRNCPGVKSFKKLCCATFDDHSYSLREVVPAAIEGAEASSVFEAPPVGWLCDMPAEMNSAFNTFLLVLAAIFPVVNPPGNFIRLKSA